MYNTKTEEAIRLLPHIDGIDNEKLPEILTGIYTRIIGIDASYSLDEIPFRKVELESDYATLQKIAFVLELKLIVITNQSETENIAYVAATCREMMAMIEEDKVELSLETIPSLLTAALLFTLANNFPDAIEMLQKIDTSCMNFTQTIFVKSLIFLYKNQIDNLIRLKIENSLIQKSDLKKYAEHLMWIELTKGVKNIGEVLSGKKNDNINHFKKVFELSSYDGYIFDATYKIASFLQKIEEIFIYHSTINIPAPINSLKEEWKNALINYSKRRAYVWQNHIDAIGDGVLNNGISSVIVFPTGAGKSTLYELKVISTLLQKKEILILVPTHALEAQVKYNMKKISETFDVGFSNIDGEFTFIDDTEGKSIFVMTPERCLTLLGIKPSFVDNIGLVVFDEFHLISGNQEDKRAMESMLCVIDLFTRVPQADYMFLSAMVDNGYDIARWVSDVTKHECIFLDNKWKPTCQLKGCILYEKSDETKLLKIIKDNQKINKKKKLTLSVKYKKALLATPYCIFSLNTEWNEYDKNYSLTPISDVKVKLGYSYGHITPNVNNVAINIAIKFSLLKKKVIIFSLQPNFAYSTAKILNDRHSKNYFNTFFEQPVYKKVFDQISEELGDKNYSLLNNCENAMIHTSDLLPEERYLSEKYFKDENGANILVATATIAQGVNLPADMVIVAGTSRFDEIDNCQKSIEPESIMNAVGRAGRAGYCSHGVSIIIPSEVVTVEKKNGEYESNAFTIIKNVFSRGDNCLTVEDPFENMIQTEKFDEAQLLIRKSLEYRLSSSNTDAREKLSKSFAAYKSNQQLDSRINFSKNMERFLSELPKYSDIGDELNLNEISVKTGYSFEDVKSLKENMQLLDVKAYMDMSVLDILHQTMNTFKKEPCLLNKFMSIKLINFSCKWLGYNFEQALTKEFIEDLFGIIEDYLTGASLYEIEYKVPNKATDKLINARKFVLKVIPSFSYICGVIVMIIKKEFLASGNEDNEFSNDLLGFASCVKEGVLSYDMLKYKHDNRLMRRSCHNEYSIL